MDWNALTAISTAVSTLVLVVGGAVAVYQLREGRRAYFATFLPTYRND